MMDGTGCLRVSSYSAMFMATQTVAFLGITADAAPQTRGGERSGQRPARVGSIVAESVST
jgi:hypothetical protein